MPEGPEAKCFADDAQDNHSGKMVFELARNMSSKKHAAIANFDKLCRKLPLTVRKVYAVGKKVIWQLQDQKERNYYIVISLGMTGKFQSKWKKGCDFAWHFGEYLCGPEVPFYTITEKYFFLDSRHHGQIYFLMSDEELDGFLKKKVGIDLLDFAIRRKAGQVTRKEEQALRKKWFEKASSTRRSHWDITKFMMKQEEFAGIGNYIKAESLGLTRLSPHITLEELTTQRVEDLYLLLDNALAVLLKAYLERGATLRDYVDIYGKKGKFKCAFYGKAEIRVGKKSYEIIKEETADGRTTHWCPKLQH